MEFLKFVRNTWIFLVLINLVYAMLCLVTGKDFDFRVWNCVIIPIIYGVWISCGMYLKTKILTEYKELEEQKV